MNRFIAWLGKSWCSMVHRKPQPYALAFKKVNELRGGEYITRFVKTVELRCRICGRRWWKN